MTDIIDTIEGTLLHKYGHDEQARREAESLK